MTPLARFETTNICLGAALLALIPDSSLSHISPLPSVDGKRLFVISYSADQKTAAGHIAEKFVQRRLVVNLYTYNRCLNAIRDRLNQSRNNCAMRDEVRTGAHREALGS